MGTEAALLRAIELNAVAVESNKTAFRWGRKAAVDLHKVERIALPAQPVVLHLPQSLDQLVKRRVAFLTDYQDARYAAGFAEVLEAVRAAEAPLGSEKLSVAVARNLSRLMAYKDEYEVARLYTNGQFQKELAQQFEGDFTLSFNLAPPLFARKDAQGRPLKARYGSWMMRAFGLLARMKGLRGGALDLFGRSEERRMERALIVEYRTMILALLPQLTADNLGVAIELAQLPEQVRGYGHVKQQAVDAMRRRQTALLAAFRQAGQAADAARVAAA